MRVVEQYGMFSPEGDELVDRIVQAALKLAQVDAASNAETWQFAYTSLQRLAQAEGYGEATDTVVREEVFSALWDNLSGFNLTEDEYWFYVKEAA